MLIAKKSRLRILMYDPSSGCKIVSTQYLEFEKCFVSPMRLIFKTFCRGGWFIGDGGACLKLEKQPFMSCLFISLTAFNTEKLSEKWNQWKGQPIFRAQPLVIRWSLLKVVFKEFCLHLGTVKCDERNHGNWGGLIRKRRRPVIFPL